MRLLRTLIGKTLMHFGKKMFHSLAEAATGNAFAGGSLAGITDKL